MGFRVNDKRNLQGQRMGDRRKRGKGMGEGEKYLPDSWGNMGGLYFWS